MKQLVILSGKGGTGKTSLAAAFAHLAHEGEPDLRAVLADADVDASNLELVLSPEKVETHAFIGGSLAFIDQERCLGCGICEQVCRFEAISRLNDEAAVYQVDPIACEGCAACMYQCPEDAIHMQPQQAGNWYRSDSRYGPLFHADLFPAQENSGKLVTMVKQQARLLALEENRPLVVVDGPPGIGCPVISAMAGADYALLVTEPTAAGIHDLKRTLDTARHFNVPAGVVINKADLYPAGTVEIEEFCRRENIEMLGKIPFDPTVTAAMRLAQPVTAYQPDSSASLELIDIWKHISHRILKEKEHYAHRSANTL
jgi:MinD superfamily P-loop ATPase